MRRPPTPPASFANALLRAENERHERRLAMLKAAAGRLKMFDETWKALEARKIHISLDAEFMTYGRDALSLTTSYVPGWDRHLHDALLELGYVEESRSDAGSYSTRVLKKGRLKVSVMIRAEQEAAA